MHNLKRITNPTKHLFYKTAKTRWNTQLRNLYEQGQSPEKNIREYFYYIDHQGMVSKNGGRSEFRNGGRIIYIIKDMDSI